MLKIANIQRGCVYDGPGVRTTVFLRGCTYRCPWCCNPETISERDHYLDWAKCQDYKGRTSTLCDSCERLGGKKPLSECPFGVYEKTYKEYDAKSLERELEKDYELMRASGGGVTFSGGEPLLFAKELEPILESLVKKSISVCFETSLNIPEKCFANILDYANTFLIDLKFQQENKPTETYVQKVKQIVETIREKGRDTIFRMVFVNSVWSDRIHIINHLRTIGVRSVELLECHNLARKKYEKLDMVNIDYTPNKEYFNAFGKFLVENGIECKLIRI